MRVFFFSAHSYDRRDFAAANGDFNHELQFTEATLTLTTAPLAHGYPAICTFVNDILDRATLSLLAEGGTRLIALRCAGFNQVDLEAAQELGFSVVRVPAYSPHAVAEHAVGLIMTLNRKFHRAYARVRENNFRLSGLEGFDLYGKAVGVVGTGRIGCVFAQIMLGFGCEVFAFDPKAENRELTARGVRYLPLEQLLPKVDILSLHCPLTPESHYLINRDSLQKMKPGAMLINTSRGGLLDTAAVVEALKSHQLGYLGLDVYEQEGDLFFSDLSNTVVDDDVFQRLLTFPNVVITGHQAYFTREALNAIARTTLGNIREVEAGRPCANAVTSALVQSQ
ncbi:MAG: 2-hydroxyacid dehydrogenase [Pseudomonadota bacterium]|nr:hydroxyacid dehydrogenase [Pseudomonadales bacterium]MDY6920365.1 2-hydroxyacid dehydrogenase [Pseudomonadota bacterium]